MKETVREALTILGVILVVPSTLFTLYVFSALPKELDSPPVVLFISTSALIELVLMLILPLLNQESPEPLSDEEFGRMLSKAAKLE